MKKGVFCLLALLLAACSHPRIIPDDQLAMIFRDAFLTNAYMGGQRISADSLQVYEPIFAEYGYTIADVQYTIGNFSKRKSARLSDVVEASIKLLDEGGAVYDKEVAILDTINNASRRALAEVVYSDTLIRVRQLKDTTRLRVVVPRVKPGEYTVSLRYVVDTVDKNDWHRGGVWLDRPERKARDFRTFALRHDREERFTRTLTADSLDTRLILDFAGLPVKPTQPDITIRDLEITYTPPASIAVDSFYRRQVDIRIFADRFFRYAGKKDSL